MVALCLLKTTSFFHPYLWNIRSPPNLKIQQEVSFSLTLILLVAMAYSSSDTSASASGAFDAKFTLTLLPVSYVWCSSQIPQSEYDSLYSFASMVLARAASVRQSAVATAPWRGRLDAIVLKRPSGLALKRHRWRRRGGSISKMRSSRLACLPASPPRWRP